MEFISEYGLFLLKAVTIVVAIVLTVFGITATAMRNRPDHDGNTIEVEHINDTFDRLKDLADETLLSDDELKKKLKQEKKDKKKADKAKDKETDEEIKKRLFIINFEGDIEASEVESLRVEIDFILLNAHDGDRVLVKVDSGGGAVHGYGLAASQLKRLRDNKIHLTVSVDKVAASGGYLMACVADEVIAAPFAIVGSIGVLMQMPNFHKILKKNDVEFEQITAGKYKRTLTMLGENTDEGRVKMQEELEEVHLSFKNFVAASRPNIDLEQVATGEHWLAEKATDYGLVDTLQTSDDFILSQYPEYDLLNVKYCQKESFRDKIEDMIPGMKDLRAIKSKNAHLPKFM